MAGLDVFHHHLRRRPDALNLFYFGGIEMLQFLPLAIPVINANSDILILAKRLGSDWQRLRQTKGERGTWKTGSYLHTYQGYMDLPAATQLQLNPNKWMTPMGRPNVYSFRMNHR
ncbi:MAG: hypothetical protein R8K48_08055 [Gallionella sp.]